MCEDKLLSVMMPASSLSVRQDGKGKFVSFDIVVQGEGKSWVVHRRYNDFCALWETLRTDGVSVPPLPPKQLWGRFEAAAIERRRTQLEEVLRTVVADAGREVAVLEFLGARTQQSLDSFPYATRSGRYRGFKKGPPEADGVKDHDAAPTPQGLCGSNNSKCAVM